MVTHAKEGKAKSDISQSKLNAQDIMKIFESACFDTNDH